MNMKTLISALILALGLGTLALPGTAAARDYGNNRDRQQHSRDHGDRNRDRGHYNRQDRNRHEYRRHDSGNHYGHYRHYPYPYVRYDNHRRYVGSYGYFLFAPQPIIHIESRW